MAKFAYKVDELPNCLFGCERCWEKQCKLWLAGYWRRNTAVVGLRRTSHRWLINQADPPRHRSRWSEIDDVTEWKGSSGREIDIKCLFFNLYNNNILLPFSNIETEILLLKHKNKNVKYCPAVNGVWTVMFWARNSLEKWKKK